jgi:hypothetical protein
MAQKVQILLIDDIDGSEAAHTVRFGLDNVAYEIDLSDANAGQLRESLATWVAHARKTTPSARAAATTQRQRARVDPAQQQDMRQWARENGYQVRGRGRISQEIQAAYQAAH